MALKDPARGFARAMCALRIFTGLVWLSNGLAKLFEVGTFDLGFFSFNLITKDAARTIATGASGKTGIAPLADFYHGFVLPNWGFFGAFLTAAELAVGVGLILGIATRLAAVGGLLLIGPIWIMLWHTGGYLWEYPAEDLFPLLLLAIVPAGRIGGLDARLAERFAGRWPF
ncbi:DoxX family membrane protein [Amycolatopsis nalaikhensis]|uniref:DoxX family membrane protein n=1 Tax=Amycolatopsis nalaikhensis TaxID=715472 RepID=A0ABY8XUR1_9PSEU|nr:DoxX family membrane protein [Amycolatopsis sp. 2-2]WIV59170.1 DoxX family membrane protein [Amycolatopsis sp. 2-2]